MSLLQYGTDGRLFVAWPQYSKYIQIVGLVTGTLSLLTSGFVTEVSSMALV